MPSRSSVGALVTVAAIVACVASPARPSGLTTQRTFGMPGRPSLQLDVPLRWKDAVEWSRDGQRVKVRLWDGDSVAMVLSPVWDEAATGGAFLAPERVRAVVEDSARAALGVSAGTSLGLEEVGARSGSGYLFTVTDPTVPNPPPPGSFAVMTQGAIPVGECLLTVTVLTHAGSDVELADALAVLRSARSVAEAGDTWRQPSEPPDPRARRGVLYDLTLPQGVVVESEAPLSVVHPPTGATFTVSVLDGADWRAALRDLRRKREVELGDGFVLRRHGKVELAGIQGGELLHVEERADADVHEILLPAGGATLQLTWRAPSSRAREAAPIERALLDTLRLIGD